MFILWDHKIIFLMSLEAPLRLPRLTKFSNYAISDLNKEEEAGEAGKHAATDQVSACWSLDLN